MSTYIILKILLILKIISCLEYEKNIKIRERRHKINITYVKNLTSISEIPNLFKQPKNIILVFSSTFCFNCGKIISTFHNASLYDFVNNSTNIYIIHCNIQKEICQNYNISYYPTIQVYLYSPPLFKETFYLPFSFDLDDILEYIDKISYSFNENALIKIKSMKELNKFSKNFGDVSFTLILKDNDIEINNNLITCYNNYAHLPEYLPRFYFSYIYSSKFKNNYNMRIPTILMTGINYKDFNINKKIEKCSDIIEFIEENQYPLFLHINQKYVEKYFRLKKTIVIFTLDKNSISNIQKIMSMIQNISMKKRNVIFGYVDIEKDYDLISFFKIKENIDESIIVYNMELGKFYIDNYKDPLRINLIIEKLENNTLHWKSGYLIEDFLYNIGIRPKRSTLIFCIFFVLAFLAIIFFLSICICLEKIDKKLK